MNQTKKRLTIINLAISMTDIETIQLQVLKLALLKSDTKIGEILSALNAQNYAQAQGLITEYIESPNETVLQRTTQNNTPNQKEKLTSKEEEDKATIEEFDLFTTPAYEASENFQEEVNYDAFLNTDTKPKKNINKQVNYDTLLNVDADDVLPNNIDLDISQTTKETEQDNTTSNKEDDQQQETNKLDKEVPEETAEEASDEEYLSLVYEKIPHISTKFNNLYNQYPPIEHTNNRYNDIESWFQKISTNGYTELEVITHIKKLDKLKQTNLAEAAQVLIATAATDSLYALFQLGRALYKGDILQKNIPEAVTLIHYLAINEEYPEAMCDLAQFYEKGIEVNKDIKKAEALYKEATELGIQRASKHYKRIQLRNKKFFKKLKA